MTTSTKHAALVILEAALPLLAFREREIVKLRYGIGDGYVYTIEEVATIFKVTKARLRSIEGKALEKSMRMALSCNRKSDEWSQ